MSLPQLAVPEDIIKLFSLPKPVKIRPYLVGEEKLLLIAQAAEAADGDAKEVEKAVNQIITRCTFGQIDVDVLPSFDVEYLFLQLRGKSVNNVIESQFRCKNTVPSTTGERECNHLVPIKIDINDIKLNVPENHTNKIMLDDRIGITLKYPTAAGQDAAQNAMDLSEALVSCLATIFTVDGEVFEVKEQEPKEVLEFVEKLTLQQVEKIRTQFFDTIPRLQYTFTFACPKCGYTEEVTLEGLLDFFD